MPGFEARRRDGAMVAGEGASKVEAIDLSLNL
jgi:hypothetical protein